MPTFNLETASREELLEEIQKFRALESSIARIEELHATPGKMDVEFKLNPALKEYLLRCFAEILADAPNYTESKFELTGHSNGEAKWITVTVLKSFGKTPHELRKVAEAEVARLKSGDFTPEEFQNLCHKFDEKDHKAFCDGCEAYQKKLFGESPITKLKEDLERQTSYAKEGWRFVSKLIAERDKLKLALEMVAECNHKDLVNDNGLTRHRAVVIAEKALKSTVPNSGSMPD